MTNHRLQLHITIFLASIFACSAFTTSSSRKTSCTSTLAARNNRQRQHPSNEPKFLQQSQQFRVTHVSPFLDSNLVGYQRSPSTVSSLFAATSGDESSSLSSSSSEDKAAAAAAVPTWKRALLFYKYNEDGSLKSKSDPEDDGLTFKQKLAKMGLSALLSYGFVSNLSYCVTVSLA
mmetsp:Transcript_1491/g.3176  ORF Transcript_1491/g.3176 Transcript_1491/m.3176 type:complete len:176 (-) Transcript_1491:47-574(-)